MKVMDIQNLKPEHLIRFAKLIDITESCWLWTGTVNNSGYGSVNQKWSAHRLAFRLFVGEIPEGLFVLHICDNPRCCNPEHLFAGTQRDNLRDMTKKNRRGITGARGSKNAKSKLTIQKAREIRMLYSTGQTSHQKLADIYGVTKRAITMILNNLSWNEEKYDYDK